MAESTTAPGSTLPPPSTTGAAPGQASYENGSQSHMPPPLNIPQNNSTIGAGADFMSPMSVIRRMAPEPNKRALYVGGLDPRVTEDVLKQIFETTGHVQNVKIIPDKNVSTTLPHKPHDPASNGTVVGTRDRGHALPFVISCMTTGLRPTAHTNHKQHNHNHGTNDGITTVPVQRLQLRLYRVRRPTERGACFTDAER